MNKKKYYVIAIDNNNFDAMNNLGRYFEEIDNNYELIKKKYCLLAINNNIAMNNLVIYYKKTKTTCYRIRIHTINN